jgi:hypothetical protein
MDEATTEEVKKARFTRGENDLNRLKNCFIGFEKVSLTEERSSERKKKQGERKVSLNGIGMNQCIGTIPSEQGLSG